MTALDLDDLRKLARGAADRARNVTLSPFTVLALIERVEAAEAALEDLREIVAWAGVQLGASSIEHLRALAASSSEVPR